MKKLHGRARIWTVFVIGLLFIQGVVFSGEGEMANVNQGNAPNWYEEAVDYARIMSQVNWTPVAEGMPSHPRRRDAFFTPGEENQGTPYSNGGYDGRYIGYDIFLKTFLAAVQNPESVLYTEDLRGQRTNSGAFYGMVCSTFTSYALQYAAQYPSRAHPPPHRDGIRKVDEIQEVRSGDVVFWPGHVEIVTGVTRDAEGNATHIRVEDSWPPTTRTINRSTSELASYFDTRNADLYRITDLNAWRRGGNAGEYLFPDYEEDAAAPGIEINTTLLLDYGDWVPYRKGQPVKFNIMNENADVLVIQREGEIVERIDLKGTGVVKRSFSICGDYTAHCVMDDQSVSQACEFSVCRLASDMPAEKIKLSDPWKVEFDSENMDVIYVRINRGGVRDDGSYISPHYIWLNDNDRQEKQVEIPPGIIQETGTFSVVLYGENRYGRLNNRHTFTAVE